MLPEGVLSGRVTAGPRDVWALTPTVLIMIVMTVVGDPLVELSGWAVFFWYLARCVNAVRHVPTDCRMLVVFLIGILFVFVPAVFVLVGQGLLFDGATSDGAAAVLSTIFVVSVLVFLAIAGSVDVARREARAAGVTSAPSARALHEIRGPWDQPVQTGAETSTSCEVAPRGGAASGFVQVILIVTGVNVVRSLHVDSTAFALVYLAAFFALVASIFASGSFWGRRIGTSSLKIDDPSGLSAAQMLCSAVLFVMTAVSFVIR